MFFQKHWNPSHSFSDAAPSRTTSRIALYEVFGRSHDLLQHFFNTLSVSYNLGVSLCISKVPFCFRVYLFGRVLIEATSMPRPIIRTKGSVGNKNKRERLTSRCFQHEEDKAKAIDIQTRLWSELSSHTIQTDDWGYFLFFVFLIRRTLVLGHGKLVFLLVITGARSRTLFEILRRCNLHA